MLSRSIQLSIKRSSTPILSSAKRALSSTRTTNNHSETCNALDLFQHPQQTQQPFSKLKMKENQTTLLDHQTHQQHLNQIITTIGHVQQLNKHIQDLKIMKSGNSPFPTPTNYHHGQLNVFHDFNHVHHNSSNKNHNNNGYHIIMNQQHQEKVEQEQNFINNTIIGYQMMNRNARKPNKANHGKRPCSRIARRAKRSRYGNPRRK